MDAEAGVGVGAEGAGVGVGAGPCACEGVLSSVDAEAEGLLLALSDDSPFVDASSLSSVGVAGLLAVGV